MEMGICWRDPEEIKISFHWLSLFSGWIWSWWRSFHKVIFKLISKSKTKGKRSSQTPTRQCLNVQWPHCTQDFTYLSCKMFSVFLAVLIVVEGQKFAQTFLTYLLAHKPPSRLTVKTQRDHSMYLRRRRCPSQGHRVKFRSSSPNETEVV